MLWGRPVPFKDPAMKCNRTPAQTTARLCASFSAIHITKIIQQCANVSLHLPLPPQTDNLKCKLCPKNWMLYENKCYWTSDEKQTWNKSQNICAAKNSQLAVFHNKEELDFIRRITDGAHLLWIGLTTISGAQEWSWIDGSPLNTTLLEVTGPAQANSCGMLKLNKVILEACTAVTKWICEKDALLL
ncbi:Killer cell lectin-like receptor subfamily F member 1 [Varanus komodoensis]|nr:Killer cell lectin-like receptor subfamily F member 1 [Varanus komodoensis]